MIPSIGSGTYIQTFRLHWQRVRYHLGLYLHALQDFYAHSNWVELGQSSLIDDGLNLFHIFVPFEKYKGFVIIQGEEAPSDVTLSRTDKVINVNSAGSEKQGLITGAVYAADDCPDDVTIGHWDSGFPGGNMPGENEKQDGLNKDHPGRLGHTQARAFTIQQTTHEWCRLLNLQNAS